MEWGISRLIGLKATLLFLSFTYLRVLGFTFSSIPFLYSSLIMFLVSIASHPLINVPFILGKNLDGSFPIWSLIMFSPFLAFVRVFSVLRRFVSREPPYSEVCEGVFVGGWPSASSHTYPPGNLAIIDCTCEFPRSLNLSRNAYMCIATWDTRSPRPEDIELAVGWACRKRGQNRPVFIHCAYGHGRSVAVTCALLVALGIAQNWKIAEKIIRERRPHIRMNGLHRKALEEWSKDRVSFPKKNVEDTSHVSSIILSSISGSSSSRTEGTSG